MARLPLAPTKSNLIMLKDQLETAVSGYELLEQKREILVMELMRMLEQVRVLERDIQKQVDIAYFSLRRMFVAVGIQQVETFARRIDYDFLLEKESVTIAGMHFPTLSVSFPERTLVYSFLNSFADCDQVMVDFFNLLDLLTKMASIRTIAWQLAREVKKIQRRVNALDTYIIPQFRETYKYIESALEERERENTFVLKILKSKQEEII